MSRVVALKCEDFLIRFKGAGKQASGFRSIVDLRLESFNMKKQAMLSSPLLIIKWVS